MHVDWGAKPPPFVISGGAHLRGLAHGIQCSEETSQGTSDLTGPGSIFMQCSLYPAPAEPYIPILFVYLHEPDC